MANRRVRLFRRNVKVQPHYGITEVFENSTMIIFAEFAIEIWQKNCMQISK